MAGEETSPQEMDRSSISLQGNGKDATPPQENVKDDTSPQDDGKYATSPQGNGKDATSPQDDGQKTTQGAEAMSAEGGVSPGLKTSEDASGKLEVSTWGTEEGVVEQKENLEVGHDDVRHSRRSNKRRIRHNRNFSKRNKVDKPMSCNGHMQFEEKEFTLLQFTDHLQAQSEIEEHFNKRFSFTKPHEDGDTAWKLPTAETMYTKKVWQDEELQSARITLNNVKQQLTNKDIAKWHAHTKNTNPAELISFRIRRKANPEMVTQAWLKFYEIVSQYPLVPPDEEPQIHSEEEKENVRNEKSFNSVHLCEAPGAFIVALNHYLALLRPDLKWLWLGNTLNPYYEGSPSEIIVVEDKLIYQTMHNWTFGQDNTGDLMAKENLDDLVQRADCMGPIHLVTADGSIDCQTSPAEQEIITHDLHLCEVVAGMSILAPGGSLVVKKFTFFESETINLMYLLCCVFKEVHVVKPGTSKEGNSEVYAVCLNYCGKEHCMPHLQKLMERYANYKGDLAMFGVEDIPEDFMVQLKNCAKEFMNNQIKVITKNLTSFETMTERDNQYNDVLKMKASSTFFEICFCDYIEKERTLTENKVNKSRYLLESDLNKPITSSLVRNKCPKETLCLCKKYLGTYVEEFMKKKWILELTKHEDYNVSKLAMIDLEHMEFDVIRGKPCTDIKTSKFCSPKIQESFRIFNKLWDQLEDKPSLTLDDSLLEFIVKEYPNAEVLKTELTSGPTTDLGAMMEGLVRIKTKQLSEGDSLVLFNVTLLSRLQCGLLFLLGCAFQNVVLYTSLKFGEKAPVIVLEKFKSAEQGEAVMKAIYKSGWNPFEESTASARILQLVPFQKFMEKLRLCGVYYYNLHHCIHRSLKLQSGLEGKLM